MSLRKKILLAIGSTLVGLVTSFGVISYFLLEKDFIEYEQQDSSLSLQNMASRISRESDNLIRDWLDWSRWDEMYNYATTGNARVLKSSLTNIQFQDNRINLIAILNRDRQIIFSTNFNLQTNQQFPLSADVKKTLQNPAWQISTPEKRIVGIVKIDNQPMMIAIQPILGSSGKGPIGGILIAGKFLNRAWFEDLRLANQIQPSIELVENGLLLSDRAIALTALQDRHSTPANLANKTEITVNQKSQPAFFQLLNSDRLVSYTLLPDLDNKSSLLLRVEMPRIRNERLTNGLFVMLAIISLGGICLSGIILFLIEKLVLTHLFRITREIQKIGSQADLSQRISNQSDDEIGSLTNTLNTMLEAIEFRNRIQIQVEQEKEILLYTNQSISSAPDFETAIMIALSRLGEITNSIYGEVWIVSADGMVLHCDSPWYCNQKSKLIEEFRSFSEGISLLPFEELPGEVWQSLRSQIELNFDRLNEYTMRQELALKCGFTSHICLPILKGEDPNTVSLKKEGNLTHRELIAVFSYFSANSTSNYDELDQNRLKLVSEMASQLGVALRQKQTEAEFQTLFAAMNDAIMIIDSQGFYLKIAPTNNTLLIKNAEALIGKQIHDIFDKDKADQFIGYIKRSLNNNQTINPEYSLDLDGRTIWFSASISPVTEDSVLWVIRDISDRKAAEFALQEALESAKVASRAKSEFLSNMSHELRTPLNAILGFTQLISFDENLSSEQQERLQIVSRSGEHLLSLINDVLEMSKIESGRTTLNLQEFDLYQLLQDLKDMLRLRAESKGLYLQIQRHSQVPQFVKSDEMKLRQVLINILGNAIKFTQAGGVSLTIACESANQDNQIHLSFRIKDSGFGIAAEEIDNIFAAFIQSESGRKSAEGTGLGLPISRTFVRMMGGDIRVESELGEGTTFSFNIQAEIGTASNLISVKPAPNSTSALNDKATDQTDQTNFDKSTVSILLAEDNLVNQKVALQMLKRLGYKADVVINGVEVLKKIATTSYDLILMDVQMPEMDGIEATIAIREKEKNLNVAPLKIIAMTANAMIEDRDRCLAIGMNDHLSKPVRLEELKACILKWIN
jgi:PAS domain S-box-containing protein